MPLLRLDLHVHTVKSKDGHTRIEDLPSIIRAKKMDGIAVTEHDNFDPPSFSGTLIVPGIEVSSRDGHVLALGVREAISSKLPADETIRRIRDQGGLAIVPHPYDPVCKCVRLARLKTLPDAVEVINADALSFHLSSWLAHKDALKLGLPQVAGSDSHIPQTIGDAYTLVESDTRDLADIIEAIRTGRVRAEGHATSVTNKLRKLLYGLA